MPIRPLANVVNAVFLARANDRWMDRLRAALLELSRGRSGRDQAAAPDALKVALHLDALERRLAGELVWERELDRARADARPGAAQAAVARAYNDMIEAGGQLPRYEWAPLHVTADLFNPKNEANEAAHDPELEAVELMAHTVQLYPWARGALLDGTRIRPSDPSCYARMGKYGEAFGELVARWCEVLEPVFAFADLKNSAPFMARAAAGRTDDAPRYWDYLWPISYWSPELLAERPGLDARLEALDWKPEELSRVDPFERTGLKMTTRRLATGGLFVQYRTILGNEGRGSRATVDAPLAERAGLKKLD